MTLELRIQKWLRAACDFLPKFYRRVLLQSVEKGKAPVQSLWLADRYSPDRTVQTTEAVPPSEYLALRPEL